MCCCTTSREASPKAFHTGSGNSLSETPLDCSRSSAAPLRAENSDHVQMLLAAATCSISACCAGVRLSKTSRLVASESAGPGS